MEEEGQERSQKCEDSDVFDQAKQRKAEEDVQRQALEIDRRERRSKEKEMMWISLFAAEVARCERQYKGLLQEERENMRQSMEYLAEKGRQKTTKRAREEEEESQGPARSARKEEGTMSEQGGFVSDSFPGLPRQVASFDEVGRDEDAFMNEFVTGMMALERILKRARKY